MPKLMIAVAESAEPKSIAETAKASHRRAVQSGVKMAFGTDAQKEEWLPSLASGKALAMRLWEREAVLGAVKGTRGVQTIEHTIRPDQFLDEGVTHRVPAPRSPGPIALRSGCDNARRPGPP